jgi:hypothetical protein
MSGPMARAPQPRGKGTAVALLRGTADSASRSFLAFAATWDAAGWLGLLAPWWPPISYVMIAAGIVAGCTAVLVRTLQRRRLGAGGRGAAYSPGRGTLIELIALGLLLGGWILRGDAEIPADPPIVAAQLVGFGMIALAAVLRARSIRRDPDPGVAA